MAKNTKTEKVKNTKTEKVEYNSEVPIGFIRCIVLKDYEDKVKGEELTLVERRYKSLAARGFVK